MIISLRIVVASGGEGAASQEAGAVVERGIWIVVGVGRVRTTLFVRIANVIVIHVLETIAATHTDGVILVSIAVAVSFRNVFTSALEDCARPSTHATGIDLSTRPIVKGCIRIVVAGC